MLYKRSFSVFAAYIVMLSLLMAGAVSAASVQVSIGEYDTEVYKGSSFIVPVSVSVAGGTGTVSVAIYPADGLGCDTCVRDIIFDAAGTRSVSFTVRADNTGTYENPFDVEASMAEAPITSSAALGIVSVVEMPVWILDFTSSKDTVSAGDTVLMTLSMSVTGPVDSISADLDYPSSGWSLISGNETYDIGKVTGTYSISWMLRADAPSQSNDFSVDVISSDPSKHSLKTLSISGPQQPSPSGGSSSDRDEDENIDNDTVNISSEAPVAGKKEATVKTGLSQGIALENNAKLRDMLGEVFGMPAMDVKAMDSMLRNSKTISSRMQVERKVEVSSGRSYMRMSMQYEGNETITDFVIYDIVPKSFAQSAGDIKVTAPGATVLIVEDDPEFAIIFSSLSPGETINIDYEVDAEVDADIVSSFSAEVYASAVGDDSLCAQVITPARDLNTGECVEYPTPCDVPDGWDVVESCAVVADNISDGPQSEKSSIYKYMILASLLGIVGMVIVLRGNRKRR